MSKTIGDNRDHLGLHMIQQITSHIGENEEQIVHGTCSGTFNGIIKNK